MRVTQSKFRKTLYPPKSFKQEGAPVLDPPMKSLIRCKSAAIVKKHSEFLTPNHNELSAMKPLPKYLLRIINNDR